MKIIDNFIENESIDSILKIVSDPRLSWEYFTSVVGGNESLIQNKTDFVLNEPGFRYCFVREGKPENNSFVIVAPIFNSIFDIMPNAKIWQCHANKITPNKNVGKFLLPHVDIIWGERTGYEFYTGLLYLNNAGGDTILFNERYSPEPIVVSESVRVSPLKNRFVYWETDIYHSAPATGDIDRYVININWFVKI